MTRKIIIMMLVAVFATAMPGILLAEVDGTGDNMASKWSDQGVYSPRAQDSETSTGAAAGFHGSWMIGEPIGTGSVPDQAMRSSDGSGYGFYSPRAEDSETSTGVAAGD